MITDITAMQRSGGARETTISGWDNDEITVRLKRPSLFNMAASGRIPNPLLKTAEALFMANQRDIERSDIEETGKVLLMIAKEALVEPTFDELAGAGLELTDTQLSEIYAYVIGGAAQLKRFRGIERNPDGEHDAPDAQQGVGAAEN